MPAVPPAAPDTWPARFDATSYLDAVLHRNQRPMEPVGFTPDWGDKPRRHSLYPGVEPVPLAPAAAGPGRLDTGLRPVPGDPSTRSAGLTLTALGQMLAASYAVTGRRMAPTPNEDAPSLHRYVHANWARGTASGGGLYPLEIYWASGPSGPLLPGVHNYSSAHHGMQRLLAGDVTDQVRRAVAGAAGDQFLLVTVRFWKNSFKYNSFGYHAVTMDVGTALGSWLLWSRAAGVTLRPRFDFDEPALDRLLGLRALQESVFAVVELPWAHPEPATPAPPRTDPAPDLPAGPARPVAVTARPVERSRRPVRFPTLEQVHAGTVGTGAERHPLTGLPAVQAPPYAGDDAVDLPDPAAMDLDVTTALLRRRSSFGRLSGGEPLEGADLAAILAAGTGGALIDSDVKHPDGGPALTRLAVYVNHVRGIPPGAYDHDAAGNRLTPVPGPEVGPLGLFLQRSYFLTNYNLEQAAAVVVVLARPHAAIRAAGDRAYRFVNAEVGAAAQALYTACAALGVGCGAALGFDNVAYAGHLDARPDAAVGDTAADAEWPLLIVLVGHERRRAPDLDLRLG